MNCCNRCGAGRQTLQAVWRPGPDGEDEELVAEGFLATVKLTEEVDGRTGDLDQ